MAKRHKASWIQLGQYLFSIQKDKLFRDWGFLSFDTYCYKELGLRFNTASKMLKSYAFLEKEEPRLIEKKADEYEGTQNIPGYEAVNILRLAKENKNFDSHDYADLRQSVLQTVKEPKDLRAQVKKMLEARIEEKDPKEVRRTRRNAAIKRVVAQLNSLSREMQADGMLPDFLVKQVKDLITKLQDQLED